jgi:hypothetical protein
MEKSLFYKSEKSILRKMSVLSREGGRGWECWQEGEMTQTMYAYVNK